MADYDLITLWKGEDIRRLSREDLIEAVKELAEENHGLTKEIEQRDVERSELLSYKLGHKTND